MLSTVSCERGQFSSETERSRIVNGVSFSENVPICKVCPRETYVDELGSIDCQTCPKYHGTLSTGAVSIEECLREYLANSYRKWCLCFVCGYVSSTTSPAGM